MNEAKRSRLTLLLLAAVFFAPLGLAVVYYFFGHNFYPQSGTNIGDLVQAKATMSDITWDDQIEKTGKQPIFRDKWVMFVVPKNDSSEAVDISRQVYNALDSKRDRVRRVIVRDGAPELGFGKSAEIFNHLQMSEATAIVDYAGLMMPLEDLPEQGYELFIIDPLGNVVLAYQAPFDNKGVLADLKKLLKLSSIG